MNEHQFDVGLSYRIDGNGITHAIMVDVQNVTNRVVPCVQLPD